MKIIKAAPLVDGAMKIPDDGIILGIDLIRPMLYVSSYWDERWEPREIRISMVKLDEDRRGKPPGEHYLGYYREYTDSVFGTLYGFPVFVFCRNKDLIP